MISALSPLSASGEMSDEVAIFEEKKRSSLSLASV